MTGRGPGNDGHGYEDKKGRHMDSKESKYEDAKCTCHRRFSLFNINMHVRSILPDC